jgi:hypothetical protein
MAAPEVSSAPNEIATEAAKLSLVPTYQPGSLDDPASSFNVQHPVYGGFPTPAYGQYTSYGSVIPYGGYPQYGATVSSREYTPLASQYAPYSSYGGIQGSYPNYSAALSPYTGYGQDFYPRAVSAYTGPAQYTSPATYTSYPAPNYSGAVTPYAGYQTTYPSTALAAYQGAAQPSSNALISYAGPSSGAVAPYTGTDNTALSPYTGISQSPYSSYAYPASRYHTGTPAAPPVQYDPRLPENRNPPARGMNYFLNHFRMVLDGKDYGSAKGTYYHHANYYRDLYRKRHYKF